jgi:hypothetical protein
MQPVQPVQVHIGKAGGFRIDALGACDVAGRISHLDSDLDLHDRLRP